MSLIASRAAVALLRDDTKNVDQNNLKELLTAFLDGLAPLTLTTSLTITDLTAGNASVAGRIKDSEGNNITTGRQRLLLTLHAVNTAGALDIGTATAGANTALTVLLADAALIVDTHTDGTWAVNFDTTANPDDIFAKASVLPVVAATGAVA